MLSRVKKNDLVYVISGKDRGKQGRVIALNTKDNAVLVKGIAIVTRHKKAQRPGQQGSILQEESFIPLAKVMPICTACSAPCRVRIAFDATSNTKQRACHRCNGAF